MAITRRFASEGARIVLADLNGDALSKAVLDIKKAGAPDVWTSVCDVSNEQQVEATVKGTFDTFGCKPIHHYLARR